MPPRSAPFGNRLITSQAVREQHGHTPTWVANQRPGAMALPLSVAEVQDADGVRQRTEQAPV